MKDFHEKSLQLYDFVVTLDGYLTKVEEMFDEVCSWLKMLNYDQQKVYVEYYDSGKFKFIIENGEILNYSIENTKMKIINQMESFLYFLNSREIQKEDEEIPDEVLYKISFKL